MAIYTRVLRFFYIDFLDNSVAYLHEKLLFLGIYIYADPKLNYVFLFLFLSPVTM